MVYFTIFIDLYECSVDMYARCNLLCLAMRVIYFLIIIDWKMCNLIYDK